MSSSLTTLRKSQMFCGVNVAKEFNLARYVMLTKTGDSWFGESKISEYSWLNECFLARQNWTKSETAGAWTVYSFQKFQNAVFFRDISNSFQWVTQTGLKPHQNFFFEKILKTDAASPIFRFF